MSDSIELYGIGNAITGTHDVVLQRLDTLIKNNGRMILYSAEAFQNVQQWVGIPVVYAESQEATLKHPAGKEVMSGNLPDNMRTVGRVTAANLGTGEPILRGEIAIDDPALDAMASAGEMSLSTGFSASIGNVDGQDKIMGNIVPNHVLIFRRGACRNCYPNDNSARFENLKETDGMDDESKGLLKGIKEALVNLKPAEHVQEEIKTMDTEEMKNITDENATLKAKIEAMENAAETEKKDAAWAEMKNAVPEGWLGDKEADTRKEFENNAGAFALKLVKFNAENANAGKSAEGSENGGKKEMGNAVEIEIKNINDQLGKDYGFVIMGGDE